MSPMDELAGRILALELMMQGFVMYRAMEQDLVPPQDFLAGMKKAMMGSLQHLSRPIDEHSDDAWISMGIALERLFSNVAKRIDAQP